MGETETTTRDASVRVTPRMREAVRAPRGRCPDRHDGSPFAGRYLVHAHGRTIRALLDAGLVERVWTAPVASCDAYALTEAGEALRAELRGGAA